MYCSTITQKSLYLKKRANDYCLLIFNYTFCYFSTKKQVGKTQSVPKTYCTVLTGSLFNSDTTQTITQLSTEGDQGSSLHSKNEKISGVWSQSVQLMEITVFITIFSRINTVSQVQAI